MHMPANENGMVWSVRTNSTFFCHLVPGIVIIRVQGEIRLINY